MMIEKAKELSPEESRLLLQKTKAREIVQEIMNFGVSQTSLFYIIKLLALELEDVSLMNNINNCLSQSERFEKESNTNLEKIVPKKKIYT